MLGFQAIPAPNRDSEDIKTSREYNLVEISIHER